MFRRSANAIVWNIHRPGNKRLWEVAGSRFLQSSNSSSSSSSSVGLQFCCDPSRQSGGSITRCNEEFMVRNDVQITSSRAEDVTHIPIREGASTEKSVGISGWRDGKGLIGSSPNVLAGYRGAWSWSSGWSLSRPGRSPYQSCSLLEPWKNGSIMRMLSTKVKVDDDFGQKDSEEKKSSTEEVYARPKTIDDFQHEEIVGPTVERDLSDTANQLRTSLGELTTFMANLKSGFLLLGSVQLLSAMWSTYFHGAGLILGMSQDFGFLVSFILAYLLRYFGSVVQFFSKTEERGRMRILTLSLQVSKMLALFFYRSDFVVKAAALGSVFALLGNIWFSHLSV